MKRQLLSTALLALAVTGAPVFAQTTAQQPAAAGPARSDVSPALVSACVDAQQQVASLAAQVNRRLEDARQTNNAQQMRAALADLQATLVEIRTRAEQCSPLLAATQSADPHAGHGTAGEQKPVAPGTPVVQPGSTTPAPGAPDPHGGHNMPALKAPSATKPSPAAADPHAGHAPAAPKAASPAKRATKPADPHAGHEGGKPVASKSSRAASAAKPGAKQAIDPVCGKAVDPATAPNTTYKGVTYHFCSPEDRLRFIRNPETYLKKAKQ